MYIFDRVQKMPLYSSNYALSYTQETFYYNRKKTIMKLFSNRSFKVILIIPVQSE